MESVQFLNGATLKFMSGGGGDKSRAGFTSRVVVIPETDGMDRPGAASRESDKITQLEARTRAYGARKRIYMECTVSTEEGRTWQEYQAGTKSRIVLPCPACAGWVSPEREHFVGWKEADSQSRARQAGRFACPECGQAWTDQQRIDANRQAVLVHEGQMVDEQGQVQGEPAPTDTLGFRWSGVHNLFLAPGDLAADEWRAAHSADEDNAEKEMRQFVWCIPVAPSKLDQTALQAEQITLRVRDIPRGMVPGSADLLTAAIDLGKYLTHWIVVGWSAGATPHVVDYGRIEVASEDLGVEQALLVALREFRDLVLGGWPRMRGEDDEGEGELLVPGAAWVDAGYMTSVVYQFCREAGGVFQAAIGRGAAQQRTQWYNRPTTTGAIVKHIGEGYHLNYLPPERLKLAEVDADHWKTFAHQRLGTPLDQPGALTLFHAPPVEST